MKKLIVMMVILVSVGIVPTATVEAVSTCAAMPPEIQSNFANLTPENQQYYYNYYCTAKANAGATGVAGVGSNTGTTGGPGTQVTAKIQNPIKFDNFYDFAAAVTKAAVQIIMPFIVLAFIFAGFLFVKAQGNPTEISKAKDIFKYSIIGTFILMGAWGFAQIIGNTVTSLTQ